MTITAENSTIDLQNIVLGISELKTEIKVPWRKKSVKMSLSLMPLFWIIIGDAVDCSTKIGKPAANVLVWICLPVTSCSMWYGLMCWEQHINGTQGSHGPTQKGSVQKMEKYLFSIKCVQVWTNKIWISSNKSFQKCISPMMNKELVFHSVRRENYQWTVLKNQKPKLLNVIFVLVFTSMLSCVNTISISNNGLRTWISLERAEVNLYLNDSKVAEL